MSNFCFLPVKRYNYHYFLYSTLYYIEVYSSINWQFTKQSVLNVNLNWQPQTSTKQFMGKITYLKVLKM